MKRLITLISVLLLWSGSSWGQTTLISPTGDGGFENGSTFLANGWTTVNDVTNKWCVGTVSVPSAGTNAAFISNDNGPPTPCYTGSYGTYEDYTVNVTAAPTCPPPSALITSNVTSTTADLNWTAGGGETSWQVIYGSTGFNPASAGTKTAVINAKPYTLNPPLSPITSYDWFVRAICGSGDTSTWAGLGSFTTAQIPATIPYAETFETWPDNWTVVNGAQTNKWVVGTATAYAGTKSAYISNDGGVSNVYTITSASIVHLFRDITFAGGASEGYTLKFWWKGQGEYDGDYWDYLRVYVVDPTTVPVAGTEVSSGQVGVTYNMQGTYVEASIAIPGSYTGNTKRFVLSWTNDDNIGTEPPASVDDITIGVSLLCTWTGNVSTDWNNAGNWDLGYVPDETVRVIIPTDPASDPNVFPVIVNGQVVSCRNLTVGVGATVLIQPGGTLNVLNP